MAKSRWAGCDRLPQPRRAGAHDGAGLPDDARRRSRHAAQAGFASNGHAIALAAQDEAFRFTFEQADIIHADGQAAVFASRLLTDSPGSRTQRHHGFHP